MNLMYSFTRLLIILPIIEKFNLGRVVCLFLSLTKLVPFLCSIIIH